jgi:hypothetical protein
LWQVLLLKIIKHNKLQYKYLACSFVRQWHFSIDIPVPTICHRKGNSCSNSSNVPGTRALHNSSPRLVGPQQQTYFSKLCDVRTALIYPNTGITSQMKIFPIVFTWKRACFSVHLVKKCAREEVLAITMSMTITVTAHSTCLIDANLEYELNFHFSAVTIK